MRWLMCHQCMIEAYIQATGRVIKYDQNTTFRALQICILLLDHSFKDLNKNIHEGFFAHFLISELVSQSG